MDFKTECNEWLNPKGYYISSFTRDYRSFTFSPEFIDSNKPTIECFLNKSDEKRVQLVACRNFKLFLRLESGELSFKHPDIDRWIDAMEHYENLAENFKPK